MAKPRATRGGDEPITINRAPVLTLWAAVVAERLGYDPDEALTLGRALAGLNAQSKGRALGVFAAHGARPGASPARRAAAGDLIQVHLMGRMIAAVRTPEGVRALADGKPATPESVERYLETRFRDSLTRARAAMESLARSRSAEELAREAFALYEAFRPSVPRGSRGWGAAGDLDLAVVRALGSRPNRP